MIIALSLDESCQSTRKTIYTMKKDQIHPQWVLQVPFHQGIKQVLYEGQTWIQANFGMVSRSGYCMTFNMVASWIRKRKKISKYWMWKSQSPKMPFFIAKFIVSLNLLTHLNHTKEKKLSIYCLNSLTQISKDPTLWNKSVISKCW